MNSTLKAWYILKHLGPRIVWLRAGVYANNALGRTAKHYPIRPWDSISLAEMVGDAAPHDAATYADFKRAAQLPFLFPLGKPPTLPEAITHSPADRQSNLAERPTAAAERRPLLARRPSLAERLKLLRQDRCVYFFRIPSPEPIDWYHNPLTDKRGDATRPWHEIPDWRFESGDIRTLWEPARAAWAIDLARARGHGFDFDAAGLYWRWIESFIDACPPFVGFQWKCGQEASVRLIALALGLWSFGLDAATTPERWLKFARLAWITGHRVAHHISYAVSQKNNHALSEACGLLLVAQLFPEFRESPAWRRIGRRVMDREIRRQIYPDGAYVQQSMNYHRVMLNIATLALRLAETAEAPFDRGAYDCLQRAAEFMYQMLEPSTGAAPNYGNNDGALPLPLSECDFTDFRPAVQSAWYLTRRERVFDAGPWDEDLAWLFGTEAARAKRSAVEPPISNAFDASGYFTLRSEESWAMIRCHSYRDRQHQCDGLHLDLWWRGLNVLADSGSYQYYVPENQRLEHYFKSTAAHNVVELDGVDPLTPASRFLWLPWTRARERHFEAGEQFQYFEGELYDYARRPWRTLLRRAVVCLPLGTWLVIDDLIGVGAHTAVLRWHMLDAPTALDAAAGVCRLDTPRGALSISVASAGGTAIAIRDPSSKRERADRCPDTGAATGSRAVALGSDRPPRDAAQSGTRRIERFEVLRGVETPERVQGWNSRYYGEKTPAPTLEAEFHYQSTLRIVTQIAAGDAPPAELVRHDRDSQEWSVIDGGEPRTVHLAPLARASPRILLSEQVFS